MRNTTPPRALSKITVASQGLTLGDLFTQVSAINRLAGNYAVPNSSTACHQADYIIRPEIKELMAGLAVSDAGEIRDGVADVMFTLCGMYSRMALPFPTQAEVASLEEALNYDGGVDIAAMRLLHLCELISVLMKVGYSNIDAAHVLLNRMMAKTWAIGTYFNYPILSDLNDVVVSNMTKFDTDVETSEATRLKYEAIGVKTEAHATTTTTGSVFYVTRVVETVTGTDGKQYPKGKWLKSVNFKEPAFLTEGA